MNCKDTTNFLKSLIAISILGIGLFSTAVYAAGIKSIFDVEDKSHIELPLNVQNILKTAFPEAYEKCDLVGSLVDIGSTSSAKYYAVSGRAGKCGGSASAPVWIVRMSEDKADIILSGGGYHIEALPNLNNGLQDLRLSGGNAGSAFVEYWRYDGKTYLEQIRKDFDGSCKDFKNDPDNPFDCGSIEKSKND